MDKPTIVIMMFAVILFIMRLIAPPKAGKGKRFEADDANELTERSRRDEEVAELLGRRR